MFPFIEYNHVMIVFHRIQECNFEMYIAMTKLIPDACNWVSHVRPLHSIQEKPFRDFFYICVNETVIIPS